MKIVYTIDIDEAKLDEWTRELYDGPPDDPVPGEPKPGLKMAEGWVAEARQNIKDGYGPDTVWWDDEVFVNSITIDIA